MALRAKFRSRDQVMAQLRRVAPQAEAAAAKAQGEAAQDLAQAIRQRARRFTGEYADSIEAAPLANRPGEKPVGISQTKDPNAWGIFALYIWRFIEFGTKAHTIAPKLKKGLAWNRGAEGETVRGSVSHPGMAAQPHLFPTYRAMRTRIRRRVAGAINKAVRAIRKGA